MDLFTLIYFALFLIQLTLSITSTRKPRINEGRRDRQNLFVITRFQYIEVLFQISYYNWGKENHSLNQELFNLEVSFPVLHFHFDRLPLPLYLLQRS